MTFEYPFLIRFNKTGSRHEELVSKKTKWMAGFFQDEFFLRESNRMGLFPEFRISTGPSEWVTGEDTVLVHVRGGDYSKVEPFGCLPFNYYSKALSAIGPVKRVLILTDDDNRAREISSGLSGCIVEILPPDSLNEIEVMSAFLGAKKAIIANSSFSFWAAYYGKVEEVCFPSPWFRSAEPPQLEVNHWKSIEVDWQGA